MVKKVGDLRKKYRINKTDMKEFGFGCTFELDKVCIDLDGGYYIHWDRCNTEAKIAAWVIHLTRKRWVCPYVIRLFMLACYEYHELKLGAV